MGGLRHAARRALTATLKTQTHLSLLDALVEGMLVIADYSADEHRTLARRWRIAGLDEELRTHSLMRVEGVIEALVDYALAREPHLDPQRAEEVIRALTAVGNTSTTRWAADEHPESGLREVMQERLRDFVEALRPLLR